jgi:murein DD-endopeptidase MepM/ murein hydrolase activator NlpD
MGEIPEDMAFGQGGKDISLEYAEKNCTPCPIIITTKPVPPIEAGRLTSPFGLRIHPITQVRSVHTGIDVGATEGTPIRAAFYGVVEKAAVSSDYGNFVLMKHGDNLYTLYGHCSELLVEPGMVIRAGETIARVGQTGIATGPHLHFEVRLGTLKADPLPLFQEAYYPVQMLDN